MTVVVIASLVLTGVPTFVLGVECFAGLFGRRDDGPSPPAPPFAVLIPAHDEQAGIAATIASARAQLRSVDRLIVVADNCTDATATIAAQAGAEVITRTSDRFRGKGYALAAGRDALRGTLPAVEVVILLDADCQPEPGALPSLATLAMRDQAVVQGLYLLEPAADASAKTAISSFAFLVKNWVRQRGLRTLGVPALLQGSGMAFPFPIFDAAPFASGDLVEDLELGLNLTLAGVSVRFAESACFRSGASHEAGLRTQRTRWEHGSIAVAARFALPLFRAILRGRIALIWVLLDLLVPPLALLCMALFGVGLAALLDWYSGHGPMSVLVVAVQYLWFVSAVGGAWACFGRAMLPFSKLVRTPFYIAWKLPIYLRLIAGRERRWIRTSRGNAS